MLHVINGIKKLVISIYTLDEPMPPLPTRMYPQAYDAKIDFCGPPYIPDMRIELG